MSWVRIDDKIAFHRKVLAAGNEAFGAWCRMLAHSAGQLSDGLLTLGEVLAIAGSQAVADKLAAVGLLDLEGDGYRIHDYLEWNPSAAEVLERREEIARKRREAGRLGGQRSGVARNRSNEAKPKQTASKPEANGEAKPQQTRSKTEAPSHPIGEETLSAGAHARDASAPTPTPQQGTVPVPESGGGEILKLPTSERIGQGPHVDELLQAIVDGAGGTRVFEPRCTATLKAKLWEDVRSAGYGLEDFKALGAALARNPRPKGFPEGVVAVSWLTSRPETLPRVMATARELADAEVRRRKREEDNPLLRIISQPRQKIEITPEMRAWRPRRMGASS